MTVLIIRVIHSIHSIQDGDVTQRPCPPDRPGFPVHRPRTPRPRPAGSPGSRRRAPRGQHPGPRSPPRRSWPRPRTGHRVPPSADAASARERPTPWPARCGAGTPRRPRPATCTCQTPPRTRTTDATGPGSRCRRWCRGWSVAGGPFRVVPTVRPRCPIEAECFSLGGLVLKCLRIGEKITVRYC